MSAFIVENETINRIVTAIEFDRQRWTRDRRLAQFMAHHSCHAGAELGKAMRDMNERAVAARYDLSAIVELSPGEYEYSTVFASRAAVYRSLGCYLYQCSEGTVPEDPLYRALDEYHNELAHDIAQETDEVKARPWK